MASKALQDILGWVALTKAVNAVKDGVPNPFPPFLFTVKAEDRVIGNSVKFNRTYGTRKTARVTKYGAAPHHRGQQDEDLIESKLVHFFEEMPFNPLVLQVLRDYESYDNQMKGKRIIAHNVKTLGTLFGNSRIVMVATTLNKGAIYSDGDGNVLPTSSGAVETYSQQIDATNNIGAIVHADGTTGSIFGATGQGSWANASTDIPKQLRLLKESAGMAHGYEPTIALYGKNVPSYLIQNDHVLDFLARNPTMQTQWLKDNTIPDGLFGLTWVPAWMASYTKDDGTKVSLWDSNRVTLLPGESDAGAYWSMFEGSYLVPKTIDLMNNADAALENLEMVYGAFGYSQLTHKPVGLNVCMGDTVLPAVKLPDTIYLADVVS